MESDVLRNQLNPTFRKKKNAVVCCLLAFVCSVSTPDRIQPVVDCVSNVMAHAQKPHFVFRRNGLVHLNRRGRQFSRLMAAEMWASAVVMLDTPCSEVVWRVLSTQTIRQFPLDFPLPCVTVCHHVSTGMYRETCSEFQIGGVTSSAVFTTFGNLRSSSLFAPKISFWVGGNAWIVTRCVCFLTC